MDALKNKVEAYNECAKYLNSKMGHVTDVFKSYIGKRVLTADDVLYAKVRKKLNLSAAGISSWFYVSKYVVKIEAQKPYQAGDITHYVKLDATAAILDNGCVSLVPAFDPLTMVSVADFEDYLTAYERLGIELNGLLESFEEYWGDVIPMALRQLLPAKAGSL